MKLTTKEQLKDLRGGDVIRSGKSLGVVVDERLSNNNKEKHLLKIQWIGGGCTIINPNYNPCMSLELVEDYLTKNS